MTLRKRLLLAVKHGLDGRRIELRVHFKMWGYAPKVSIPLEGKVPLGDIPSYSPKSAVAKFIL